MGSFVSCLECTLCGRSYDHRTLQTVCHDCARPLYARYELDRIRRGFNRKQLAGRDASLWRYREVLPLDYDDDMVTFGEGWSPLLECPRLGSRLGLDHVLVKDEGQLPTGSFKARGMAVAVSMAKALGATSLAAPSAGNAGGALAQYGARAGLPCHVFMPVDVPQLNRIECVAAGASTYLVRGLINDCGKIVRDGTPHRGWFDMSTLKEPYRVEGKKTMGYEVAEQMDWELPDVILYPTGGGTGLVGMWKAFDEMEQLGWIDSRRPRMVCVQSVGCAPIARAFEAGEEFAQPWKNAQTMASGIRVPVAVGDFLMLRALRDSGGTAVTVTDEEIDAGTRLITGLEGLFVCPEGGAVVAALQKLVEREWVRPSENVVLFNTGTGLKYPECFPVDLPVLDPAGPIDYASL